MIYRLCANAALPNSYRQPRHSLQLDTLDLFIWHYKGKRRYCFSFSEAELEELLLEQVDAHTYELSLGPDSMLVWISQQDHEHNDLG